MVTVASEWQRKWSRVTGMSWGELGTRASQGVSKRLDWWRYRAGLKPKSPPLRSRPETSPRFFFDVNSDRDGAAHRAELLRVHLPREADAIIDEADDICRHQFRLLGYEKVDCGEVIDWHGAQGKHSPLKPWFKINFLDFDAVGDHKLIWELNRHQHLVTLAKAWLLTGNDAYTKELTSQWYSWQRANPYPIGINWASALEAAFRSLSWLWIRNLLAGSRSLPTAFQSDVLVALQLHGRHIERYLSTYFSPNTHLLGEAVALFFIGTLCPEISTAEGWREKGWKIVLQEAQRQVRSDGVYFEQSLYYHVYSLDLFLHARTLAHKNDLPVPNTFDEVIKKMLDVVRAVSEGGAPEGFGDDDGGRVFNPRRNRVECMTDPLALGAVLYDRGDYATAGLTEEAIWMFGDKVVALFEKVHPERRIASMAFEAGGIYLINDNEPCQQRMTIDAGPQGTGNAGHGHADALSIHLSLDGRRFLIDPGTYRYISEGSERDWFRATAAHNTVTVDKLDQVDPAGPFAWKSIPNVKKEIWLNRRTFDFFSGSHDGYRRLPKPVTHRRSIFHVKGGLWFVHDLAEGRGDHLLESFWHFGRDVEIADTGSAICAQLSDTQTSRCTAATLLIDRNSGWTAQIERGSVSPAYGAKQSASVLRISAKANLPAQCGVLLLAQVRPSESGNFSAIGSDVKGVYGYRYQSHHQSRQADELLFVATENRPWKCDAWASDAKLLYCRVERDRFTHVIMVHGSFAEWRGKRFVSQQAWTESFEWSNRSEEKEAFSSGESDQRYLGIADFEVLESVR